MITSFSVQNFKGLRGITLEGMRPQVLIVGENGAGKSSILEAVYCRMIGARPERELFGPAGRNVQFNATLRDDPEIGPPAVQGSFNEVSRIWMGPAQLVPALRSGAGLAALLAEVKQRGEEQKLCEALWAVDNTIADACVMMSPAGPEVCISYAPGGGVLSLASAGGGIRNVATLMLHAMLSSENSVLLIDEIESGIHHSLYGKIWHFLASTAADKGVQIIATTHSSEFVRSAFEAAGADHADDLICAYRLVPDATNRLQRDATQIVRYGADDLDAALHYDYDKEVR